MAGESARAVALRRRSKAEGMLRSAEAFERGAEGEETTARALAELPMLGWRVFHDMRWPGRRYANIDHVVVGPTGVFVIDTKAWSGEIEVRDGVLRQDGRRRDRAVLSAMDAAAALTELLPGLDAKAVNAVLCFDRDEPVFGWADEVMVCSPANLVTLLTSRPSLLDTQSVAVTANALSRSLIAATHPVVPVSPREQLPRGLRRSVASKKRENLPWSVASILALALLAVLALTVLPNIASKAGDEVRAHIRPSVALGETVTVPGNPLRPELQLSVERLSPTRAIAPGRKVAPDHRLYAAQVTIHNVGKQTWVSGGSTTFTLVDESHTSHPQDSRVTQVRAGSMFPARTRVKSGVTKRGVVVFDVPRALKISTIQISVGPGLAKTVRWSLG
jgi:hypothetical protein